jgi:predicted outer membrane repeat protein
MRKFLTPLAAISLIGSLFLGVPAPAAAAGAGSAEVHTSDTDVIHVDTSRNTAGRRQTYLAEPGDTLDMSITVEASDTSQDLGDWDITLSLKNGSLNGTYGDDTGYPGFDGSDTNDDACALDWNETNESLTPTASVVAGIDCNAGTSADGAADYQVTLYFTVVLPDHGSSVLTVSGIDTGFKVFFMTGEDGDDIFVGSGTLPAAAGAGTCEHPDFSTDSGAQGNAQEAMFAALAAIDQTSDTLFICNDMTYSGDIEEYEGVQLYDVELNIQGVLDVDGNYPVLDGAGAYQLLNLDDVDADILWVTFYDADYDDEGGALLIHDGNLALRQTLFDSNHSDSNGGAVMVYTGNLDVVNSDFMNNDADQDGGAIHIYTGTLDVNSGSSFLGNDADNRGGAIYHAVGTMLIDDTLFDANSAVNAGGAIEAIDLSNNNSYVSGSIFNENYTGGAGEGGAISLDDGSYGFAIYDSEFSNNSSLFGAITSDVSGNLYLGGVLMEENIAYDEGGAVRATNVQVYNSVFNRNTAYNLGGAIYADGYVDVWGGSSFTANHADGEGGAIFSDSDESYTTTWIENSTFTNNSSGYWGGALSLPGTSWIYGSTFTKNISRKGGAIDSWGDRLYLQYNKFTANKATSYYGGAIARKGRTFRGDVTRTNVFTKNMARNGGSAVAIYGELTPAMAKKDAAVWKIAGVTVYVAIR